MTRPKTVRIVCGGVLVLVALLGMSTPFAAAASSTTNDVAFVRAAHLSPDTPKVDVYLSAFSGGSSKLWLSGVGYGDFSGYRRMSAGQYAVSMRPHGAAASTAAALSWTVALEPGKAYTAAAYGQNGQLRGVVYDDASAPPAKGSGSIRIVQGSGQAGQLSATAGGTAVASNTAYGSISDYVTVPAGSETVRASSQADSKLKASLTVSVASRSVTSVVVLDQRKGGLVMRPLVDAAGAASPPAGAVPAGGGGTAVPRAADVDVLRGVAGVLGLAGVGLIAWAGMTRRRPGTV